MIWSLAYFAALIGVGYLVWNRGGPAMKRTAAALAGNALLTAAGQLALGDAPSAWFLVIDIVAAIVVTMRPAGNTQATIAEIYWGMCIVHVAFAAATGGTATNEARDLYLWICAGAGWAQLAVLTGGLFSGAIRKRMGRAWAASGGPGLVKAAYQAGKGGGS